MGKPSKKLTDIEKRVDEFVNSDASNDNAADLLTVIELSLEVWREAVECGRDLLTEGTINKDSLKVKNVFLHFALQLAKAGASFNEELFALVQPKPPTD